MRAMIFSHRNFKEILRDPLSFAFGLGFPVVLIILISIMQRSIKGMSNTAIFDINNFAPAMAVFGLSFIALFLSMLISGDRTGSYLMRLFATPMTAADYVVGYSLPMLPVSIAQSAICFIVAAFFGLELSPRLLLCLLALIPGALLFIAIGMLMGTLLTGAQVGGIGSIVINVAAWMSGTWFPLDIMSGAFPKICKILPFYHAVAAAQNAYHGGADVFTHLAVVLAYTLVIYIAAVLAFRHKMKG